MRNRATKNDPSSDQSRASRVEHRESRHQQQAHTDVGSVGGEANQGQEKNPNKTSTKLLLRVTARQKASCHHSPTRGGQLAKKDFAIWPHLVGDGAPGGMAPYVCMYKVYYNKHRARRRSYAVVVSFLLLLLANLSSQTSGPGVPNGKETCSGARAERSEVRISFTLGCS